MSLLLMEQHIHKHDHHNKTQINKQSEERLLNMRGDSSELRAEEKKRKRKKHLVCFHSSIDQLIRCICSMFRLNLHLF